jgi:hypothetical protein
MELTVTHSESRLHRVGQDINLGTEVRCCGGKTIEPKLESSIGCQVYDGEEQTDYFGILRINIDLNV